MIGKTRGHNQITSWLGRGGIGVANKAEDTKLKRSIAAGGGLHWRGNRRAGPAGEFQTFSAVGRLFFNSEIPICLASQHSRGGKSMKRIGILVGSIVLVVSAAIWAQTTLPKPDPALKNLDPLAGHWTYEGEYRAGPLGPGGKFTGEYSIQRILGDFFFQDEQIEKGPMGETHALDIYRYNPANKNFAFNGYMNDGSTISGTLTVSGNTFTWELKFGPAGKQYLVREPFILASDHKSLTGKAEISSDGKAWIPWFEANYTKVGPVSKKK
jgi:hypothetical protein